MLISVAMIFLTMHNSIDYSYEGQEFVIAILIPIMYIVINICMYLIFCNIETKKHIRSIGIFYLIVFVFSFIDILIFEEYRGTFTEQYVFEQMVSSLDQDIFYYDSDKSKLELDYLIQNENVLVPIEVKAEENLRSKSLRQFYSDNPGSKPVRISMSDFRKEDRLTNIPLYAAERILG